MNLFQGDTQQDRAHLCAAAHRPPEKGAPREAADIEIGAETDLRHRVQPDVSGILLLQLCFLLLE